MFKRSIRCRLPDRSLLVYSDQLEAHARGVLDRNWHHTHTIPAFGLYPHEWLWDSGFIAMGLACYRPDRAIQELRRLHEGQWSTGMLPHILFDPAVRSYWPDPDYWNVRALSDAPPRTPPTSGITQPSVAPWVLLEAVKRAGPKTPDPDAILREFFPQMMAFHRWLVKARDPEGWGVLTILHPWESGLDNSPAWDAALERIEPHDLPDYRRQDVDHVDDPAQRPDQKTYDRYVHLCEQLKRAGYDDRAAYDTCDFLVKDVTSTVLFYLSNLALVEIAERIGEDTTEIEEWLERTRQGFDRRLRQDDGLHYPWDLRAEEPLRRRTVMSFLPLALDFLTAEDIQPLMDWLVHSSFCSSDCACSAPVAPSADTTASDFSAVTYWRGPLWVNVNWIIILSLYRRGKREEADRRFEALLSLVWENGFWEFYRPDTGRALGGRDFSWSAALTIDMLNNPEFAHPGKEAWSS